MNRKIIIAIIFILVAISGFLIYKKLNPKEIPPYLVAAVGRIDGDDILINTKYPGRVVNIYADTGDFVKKGQKLAVLDSKEFEEKLNSLLHTIKAKENEYNFTKTKIENSIQKASLAVKIKNDELKALEADIDALKKVINQDIKDEKRIAKLVKKNLAKEHELELARLKTKTDKDKLNALLAKKEALKKAVEIAKKDLNTAIASKENLKALKNAILALKAQRDEIKTMINELTLFSPVNGYVDTKIANKGEVVGAGMPVISVIDPHSFYLKIYVDELTNGKIHIGDKAEIFLDSFPDKPIKAVVSKIAKKAEFTPKEVEVRSDRITRVYEVRLKPLEECKYFKLGLPAIGVILTGRGELPKSLKELPEL
jgi:HlyD family secretion protein